MKKTTLRFLSGGFLASVVLFGCSKSNEAGNKSTAAVPQFALANGKHYYGCLMTPAATLAKLPKYQVTDLATVAALPKAVTLAHPPVGDQGQQGSCTGWGAATTDGIFYYYKAGLTSWSNTTDIMSASFVYNAIKVGSCDAGAYVSAAASYLQTNGDCIYNDMTYTDASCSATPSSAAVTNAATHKVNSYASITPSDINSIKAAINAHHPVIIGIEVDNAFEALNTTNYTWKVNGSAILGGHCNTIYGYDNTQKVFLVQNQWGTSWGNNGLYYIAYGMFTSPKSKVEEAYIVQ
jgi:C1A family cysteine protease